MTRPAKFTGPCRTMNCVMLESQYQEIDSISETLSERAGFHVSKGDLVRVGLEAVLSLPASQILNQLRRES